MTREVPHIDHNFPSERNDRVFGWSAHMGHRCSRCADPLGPFGIGRGSDQEMWGCARCGLGVCCAGPGQPSINAAADLYMSLVRPL